MEEMDCTQTGDCEETNALTDDANSDIRLMRKDIPLELQTRQALQQLSIIIGVALMVGILFFLMIAIDNAIEWMGEKWSRFRGKEQPSKDPEDPAALVGSFKRYK